jgi:hypothetical protein
MILVFGFIFLDLAAYDLAFKRERVKEIISVDNFRPTSNACCSYESTLNGRPAIRTLMLVDSASRRYQRPNRNWQNKESEVHLD